ARERRFELETTTDFGVYVHNTGAPRPVVDEDQNIELGLVVDQRARGGVRLFDGFRAGADFAYGWIASNDRPNAKATWVGGWIGYRSDRPISLGVALAGGGVLTNDSRRGWYLELPLEIGVPTGRAGEVVVAFRILTLTRFGGEVFGGVPLPVITP